MKVLLISAHQPPLICGIGDYTEILTQNLNSAGIEASHIALVNDFRPKFFKGLRVLLKVREALSQGHFDLIHLQYEAFSFEQSYLLLLYLTGRQQPLVVTFHEVFQKTKWQQRRDRNLFKKSAAVIVNDRGRFDSLLRLLPEAKEKVHCLWVGSNLPRLEREVSPQKALIGFFGFINGVKRLDILFNSFKIIKNQIPTARLRLVGAFDSHDLEVKKWRQWAEKEGLAEGIEWCGPQSRELSSQKIQECELMLLPFSDGASPRRGSLQAGLSLGKALLTSTPVSDEPGLAGLTFIKSTDPKGWAQQAVSILNNQNLRQALEKKSFEISQKFSWETMAARHLQIYNQVLAKKK